MVTLNLDLDREVVETAYFLNQNEIWEKKLLLVSDYIRRGSLLDMMILIAEEEAHATIVNLLAVISVGNEWKRIKSRLKGNVEMLKKI